LSTHRRFLSAAVSAVLAGIVAQVPAVHGAGFEVPEVSTAGLGLANALVANPEERGAFPYNAAAMGFHADSSIALGTLLIAPTFTVDTASGKHDSEGAEWFAAPMIQAALRLNERWVAGFGINAPFGLETRWETGTFPALTGTAPLPSPPFPPGATVPLSPQPTQSKAAIVDFVPTITYSVNDNLALSAGVDFYWAKSAELRSSLTDIEGDGHGWGFNLGALYSMNSWSFGASFRSAATLELEGDYTALNPTLVALGRLQPTQGAELELNLPWRLQLGARYKINPKLAVEFDWTRTGWSEFEEIKVIGDSGAILVQDDNNWNDTNAYRIGATYDLLDQTQLRFGYSYDETGQDDDYFSARIPDSDRHLFSVGVAHRLAQGWQVEAGYMYVMFSDRDYSGARPYTGGAELNGTTAIAGDYDAHAHLIGLEVSKSFNAF
jgi:long-chain fatty acid transport protein